MKRPLLAVIPALPILLVAQTAWAGREIPVTPTSTGYDFSPMILAGLAAILLIAKVGSELFKRAGQPAVLGELLAGIILGNLALVGFHYADWIKTDGVIAALAQIGVILLLFEVGLESNLGEMLEVGWSSLFVALAGVIAPLRNQRRHHRPGSERSRETKAARIAHYSGRGGNRRCYRFTDSGDGSGRGGGCCGRDFAFPRSYFLAGRKGNDLFRQRFCDRSLRRATALSRRKQTGESRRLAGPLHRVLFWTFMAGGQS